MDNETVERLRTEPTDGPCFFCSEEVSGADDYCYGCKKLVCPDCDKTGIMGEHDVFDHKEDV